MLPAKGVMSVFRFLRSRWMWPVLGALATTYLIRRSRQPEVGRRILGRDGGWRSPVTLAQVANVGKAAWDTAMRALARR